MNGTAILFALCLWCFISSLASSDCQDNINDVIKRMNRLENDHQRHVTQMTKLELENEQLKSRLTDMEDLNKGRNQQTYNKGKRSFPESPVAFTAVLDHNVLHSGIEQPVVFNKVLLNDGNAYNSHTGIFTVPTNGVYLFYLVFASGYEARKLWMHIVVDGVGKVGGVADNVQTNHDAQGTNLMMLHLNQGDSVWVTTYMYPDATIFGGYLFTTFSGVLLYQS